MPDAARLIARLVDALGPAGVITEPADAAPYTQDWRGRWKGSTPVVARPASSAEAAATVAICAEEGFAITPQGGNSGLVNGGVPYGEVLVSLRRMRRVREIDPANDAMTLEAGVTLVEAQEAAASAGRLFPLSLGAEGVATIGGLVSTNAGGVAVLRYGMMRELVLGLEVVLPDGRIWSGLRGLRKDNTGYDLKQLFIGAEGTLGIVTAATLKLFPRPASVGTAWAATHSPAAAVELLELARERTGGAVTGFELIPRVAVDLVVEHLPGARDPMPSPAEWRVLIEASSPKADGVREMLEDVLADAIGRELVSDAVIASSEAQAAAMWRVRENIAVAERASGKARKHDVSTPVSRLPELVERAGAAVERMAPGARIIAFGHVGDGNLHYNVVAPPGVDAEDFVGEAGEKVTQAVHDVVMALGGSISAEHGVGRLKRAELALRKSTVEMDLMRAVKQAIDPDNRMNPGRVV